MMDYVENEIDFNDYEDLEELEQCLNDELWIVDSVTGNASGSYTLNRWEAEENICHNMELLGEALEEFGGNAGEALEKGAEYCDVTIRCYLLSQAIAEVMEEIREDFNESKEA
ncbi:MAG: hypothetical protein KH972_02640 [Peptostreptococcaceae bacterium]|nr:hypothetical protein [Peptostreptococcaceae bacterium]